MNDNNSFSILPGKNDANGDLCEGLLCMRIAVEVHMIKCLKKTDGSGHLYTMVPSH